MSFSPKSSCSIIHVLYVENKVAGGSLVPILFFGLDQRVELQLHVKLCCKVLLTKGIYHLILILIHLIQVS